MYKTKTRAGMILAAALILDGLVHLYWATGRTWPAANVETLSYAVLNANVSFGPFVVIPLATLLFTAAFIVLAKVQRLGRIGRIIPDILLKLGSLALSAGLLLRGLAGIVWSFGIGADFETTFYWLNLFGYTPVCLVLFVASLLVFGLKGHMENDKDETLRSL